MKHSIAFMAALIVHVAAPISGAAAQGDPVAESSRVPTTVEYYYRIRWGALKEFSALYEKNHKPLLEEMQRQGFITGMKTEYPFTHLAGGQRWDMRVRITFRDAAMAVNDPEWGREWADAKARLYKDLKKFDAEEVRRFSLLEDHWDIIVADYPG